MSILEDRLKEMNEKKKNINKEIQNRTIIPTKKEEEKTKEIVNEISKEYKDEISHIEIGKEISGDLKKAVKEKSEALGSNYKESKRIEHIILSNINGLGPIEQYLNDPSVTEIMVLRYDHIVLEKNNGERFNSRVTFQNEQNLQNVIQRIVAPLGRQINISQPIVDARLPDGSRVHATIPPVSVDGATLTIRKFSKIIINGEDYIKLGTMNEQMLEFLEAAVKGKANIMVSGGTNTGKTTLLNLLSSYIPENEMIITIEDSCELQLKTPNLRRLETRPLVESEKMMKVDMAALVKASLRMNPDRIIVGEIRDGSVVDMISAMSTGHEGSMSTAHANSPSNLVNTRMPIFFSMSDSNFSEESQAIQIAEALDLIVQIDRRHGKRIISNITSVEGVENGRVKLRDIFVYSNKNEFVCTHFVPEGLLRKMKRAGIVLEKDFFTSESK